MVSKTRSLGIVCIILSLLLILALVSTTANAAPAHADRGEWAPYTAYAVGDTVTYQGCTYSVIQAHTSLPGWEPPIVPALFQLIGCGSSPSNTPTKTPTKTNTPTRTSTPAGATNTPTRTNTPAGATSTPTRTATPANPTSTPTSGSGGGSGCVTPWNSTSVYVNGNNASDSGRNYHANWWNQNDRPSVSTSGAWTDQGGCVPPTAGPTSQPGSGLPTRVAAIYADISFTSIQAAYQATGAKYYAIAFVLAEGGACTPAWDGSHPMSENYYSNEINAIRSSGGDVIAVFGGANGWDIATTCTSVSNLQAAYQSVINKYQFKWIDLNIEGGLVSDSTSYDRRNKAIAALEAANPSLKVSYTLPVMQTGLLQTALDLLSNAKTNGVRIDYVNVMTMNYGPSGVDMGQAAISAATNTHNQMGSLGISTLIGITPMNGQNNTSGEIFTLSDADEVVAFAQANNYVGWLSFWSLGRDNGGCPGNTTASATCSGISQNTYDFTNKFKIFP